MLKAMFISSRTPEGIPNRCPICGADVRIEPSKPSGDAPCPQCGALLWFRNGSVQTKRGISAVSTFVLGLTAMVAIVVGIASIIVVFVSYMGWTGGLGRTEISIIVVLGILLFGRKLPETGRCIGELVVRRSSR
jgi:hypothetical protein